MIPCLQGLIAQWESRTGKQWVKLFADEYGYSYKGIGCGGFLGKLVDDSQAVEVLQVKIDSGYFLPDNHKTAMKRLSL